MGDGRARGWKPGWEQPIEACGPSFGEAGTIALFPALETVHVGSLRPTPQLWSPSSSGYSMWPSHVASSARRGRNSVGLFVSLQRFCSG